MFNFDKELLQIIKENNLVIELLNGNFGLEKENVRVNNIGNLATTPHPKAFGNKLSNTYITTDFSESQIEMITPALNSLEEVYFFLDTIQNIVSVSLDSEYLWPQSTPPILPSEEEIPIATYYTNSTSIKDNQNLYREYLANKYGRKKQLISGIHYNFSFNESFLKRLHECMNSNITYRDFKDNIYLKIAKNITKYSWFIVRLLGSSPAIHESYIDYCNKCYNKIPEGISCNYTASIRNGKCGYKNINNYYVPLDSLDNYINGIKKLINDGELISSKEYYNVIRPKNSKGNLSALKEYGIEYLELRLLDINPLYKLGISLEDLYFVHLFIIFAFLLDENNFDEIIFNESLHNHLQVADNGRKKEIDIIYNEELISIKKISTNIINKLREITTIIGQRETYLSHVLDIYHDMIDNHDKLYSCILYDKIKNQGFISFHLEKAIQYRQDSISKEFNFIGYEDMELSTQILMLESLKRGVKVEILDKKENFISLTYNNKTEYVKQATKTSKDTYSCVLVMENKLVTKHILEKANIKVPIGKSYNSLSLAKKDYNIYKNKAIVIKPNSTNFGIGITIFKNAFTKEEYNKALDLAFGNDNTVLIEEFIEGKEYRVFIIDNEVVGVLHRVPANVTGDGIRSIEELVTIKNEDPLRGEGYRKPLQKIKLGIEEKMFLASQGLDFDSILEKNQLVYLRENSNISTGGDSIDYTDDISDSLKNIAIKSAKIVSASIVGVDMMIKDIKANSKDNYAIIELNFNPAIHIHCYPYIGKNRKLGSKILDLFGFRE
jgi:glutamate--cysteine ligase